MNTTQTKGIHTISFLVANKPGVLVRVAQVFARRAYNIDSLVVSPAFDERYSRMTITAQGDPETLDQIIKQSNKLVDVISAEEHKHEDAVEKELALIKIKAKPTTKTTLAKVIKKFNAQIVDEAEQYLIVEQTGSTEELDEFEGLVKEKFGLSEMVRSGKLVMARGKEKT